MIVLALATFRAGKLGGSETYARDLLRSLASRGRHNYVCLLPPAAAEAACGLPTIPVDAYSEGGIVRRGAAVAGARILGGSLRRQLTQAGGVHYMLTVPVPRLRLPSVVTLHDLLHLEQPDLFPRSLAPYRALAYDRASRRAQLVIVPSEYVKARAVERLGIAPERIEVVPWGVDGSRFTPDGSAREPFLLYPARGWPHKNHDRLFAAFALIRRNRPDLRLVLTGGGHEQLRPVEGVEDLGTVPVAELVSLYRRASALVLPSLNEGFGYPALEAMAAGCPVAVSATTALPELCGEAASYFDPLDPPDMARAIEEVIEAPDGFACRGIERAAIFTLERMAARHEDVYSRLQELEPNGPLRA